MSDQRHHLSELTWERLACGELSKTEEATAHEHIAHCDDCAATWSALSDLRTAAETFDPALREPALHEPFLYEPTSPELVSNDSAPKPLPSSFPTAAPWTTLAAAALVAVIAGVGLWPRQPALSPTAPPPATERAAEGLTLVPEFPGEDSAGDVSIFAWQGSPAFDCYTVELLGHDGSLLWQSQGLDQLQAPWPEDVEKVAGVYYWRVVAGDDHQEVPSELVRFELAP